MENLSFVEAVIVVQRDFDLSAEQAKALVSTEFDTSDLPTEMLVIDGLSFLRWLDDKRFWFGSPSIDAPQPKGSALLVAKGGAPQSHPWNKVIWPEVVLLAARGEVSDNKEAFARTVEGLLEAKGVILPSHKHLVETLSPAHKVLQREGLTKTS